MQEIGAAAKAAGKELARSSESSEMQLPAGELRPLPPSALDLIAAVLTSSYGAKWTSTHGDNFAETSGLAWAKELAGMDERHIERGLRYTRNFEWPPTLVEFRAACLGVISLAAVELQRAGEPRLQHPFTVLVGRHISSSEWRMADPQRQERMLAKAYALAREHVLSGGKLPSYTPAALQLTAEDESNAPPPIMMTTHEAMAEIRRMLRRPEPTFAGGERKRTEDCTRCQGTRVDPVYTDHPKQRTPGECLACYGSGCEAAYNRAVDGDGITREKI